MYAKFTATRVDQNRTAELTAKINETLFPQLTELPGFAGYYFVDVGNGIFTWLGLFETPDQAKESTSSLPPGFETRSSTGSCQTSPRSPAARSSLAAASASWSRSSTAQHVDEKGPACRALFSSRSKS